MHAVVVGQLPVVETFLAHLLCGYHFGYGASQRVNDVALLGGRHFQPSCHVAALQALLRLLGVNGVGQSLPCKAVFRDVAAPGHGVALLDGIVDNLHHFVHGHVVAHGEAPVVLHLYGKGCVERMVRIAGDVDIVVQVNAQRSHEALRRVLAAFVRELLGALAQIGVQYALKANLPLAADFLGITLGHCGHVWFEYREELVEVVERVAIQRAGERHGTFGHDAVLLHRGQHVLGTAAL